jgi:hypothetical protein
MHLPGNIVQSQDATKFAIDEAQGALQLLR